MWVVFFGGGETGGLVPGTAKPLFLWLRQSEIGKDYLTPYLSSSWAISHILLLMGWCHSCTTTEEKTSSVALKAPTKTRLFNLQPLLVQWQRYTLFGSTAHLEVLYTFHERVLLSLVELANSSMLSARQLGWCRNKSLTSSLVMEFLGSQSTLSTQVLRTHCPGNIPFSMRHWFQRKEAQTSFWYKALPFYSVEHNCRRTIMHSALPA